MHKQRRRTRSSADTGTTGTRGSRDWPSKAASETEGGGDSRNTGLPRNEPSRRTLPFDDRADSSSSACLFLNARSASLRARSSFVSSLTAGARVAREMAWVAATAVCLRALEAPKRDVRAFVRPDASSRSPDKAWAREVGKVNKPWRKSILQWNQRNPLRGWRDPRRHGRRIIILSSSRFQSEKLTTHRIIAGFICL